MKQVATLILIALLAAPTLGEQPTLTTILAGHLFDGEKFVTNATIVIRGGRFVAATDNQPAAPTVVEDILADDLWVIPGIVDAHSALGHPGTDSESTVEVSPRFSATTAFNSADPRLKRALSAGVTTIYVTPGTRNVIAGTGGVVTAGADGWSVLEPRTALEVTLNADPSRGNTTPRFRAPNSIYYRRPNTRMGTIWILRHALHEAQNGDEGDDVRVLREALARKLPLRTTARREEDIRAACRVAAEFGIKGIIIEEAYEAYRAADVLAERGASAVIPPLFYTERGFGPDRTRVQFGGPAALHKAGIPFAIGSQGTGEGLIEAASLAWRHGLPAEAALGAITASAADIIGVGDRAGRIAPGRRADLVFFSGHPLEPTSRLVRVMVEGRTVYVAKQQPKKKGADK